MSITYRIPAAKITANVTDFVLSKLLRGWVEGEWQLLGLEAITENPFDSGAPSGVSIVDSWKHIKVAINSTQCYVEMEFWDNINKYGKLNIRLPSLTSGVNKDIVFSVVAGDQATAGYNGIIGSTVGESVYSSSKYLGVYRAQDPSGGAGTFLNSAPGGNDGTSAGSMTSGDLVAKELGYVTTFDGVNDTIRFSSFPISENGLFARIFYIFQSYASNWGDLLSQTVDDTNNNGFTLRGTTPDSYPTRQRSVEVVQSFTGGPAVYNTPVDSHTPVNTYVTGLYYTFTTIPDVWLNGVSQSITTNAASSGTVTRSTNDLKIASKGTVGFGHFDMYYAVMYLTEPNDAEKALSTESDYDTLLIIAPFEVQELQHAHSLDGINLVQAHVLDMQNISHAHALDNTILDVKYSILPNDLTHAHSLDNIIFRIAIGNVKINLLKHTPKINIIGNSPKIVISPSKPNITITGE